MTDHEAVRAWLEDDARRAPAGYGAFDYHLLVRDDGRVVGLRRHRRADHPAGGGIVVDRGRSVRLVSGYAAQYHASRGVRDLGFLPAITAPSESRR
jgi:hypothetical protein